MSKPMLIRDRRFVYPFPVPPGGSVPPPLDKLVEAYRALNDIAVTSQTRLQALAADQNFTQVGRTNQMKAWAETDGFAAIRRSRATIQAAEGEIAAIRSRMRTAAIDKSDAAGAVLRSDIRRYWREMPDAARNAKIRMNDLTPDEVAAIMEAPPALSGVSDDQRRRLEGASLAMAFPEAVETVDRIEKAILAVASAERAASLTLQSDARLAAHEIDEALGAPTISDRIAAMLGEEEPAEEEAEPDAAA